MLNTFINYRHDLVANLIEGSPALQPPFNSNKYIHRAILRKEMPQLIDVTSDIVNGNPYAVSTVRPDKLNIWDTSLMLPSNQTQTNVTSITNVNDHWTHTVVPAFKSITKDYPRLNLTAAQYHMDYKALNEYPIIEAAHVLAHLRAENANIYSPKYYSPYGTDKHFKQALAEITVSLLFDIPINVTPQYIIDSPYHMDYGIMVTTTTNQSRPYLILPANDKGTVLPDRTVAIIHVMVFIEPYPSLEKKTNTELEQYRWCCSPTAATVVGITWSDQLTKQKIMPRFNKDYYIMHHCDLSTPDKVPLNNELAIASKLYPSSPDYVKAIDWIGSDDYEALLEATPPLPCRACLLHNSEDINGPGRPQVSMPKTLTKDNLWYGYEQDIKRFMRIVTVPLQRKLH